MMQERTRFLSALKGEIVDRPPLWLMRQAGRYLPEYRALRSRHSFWEVCHTPELSTQVALEPLQRFPLDAAIVFSDILVIPQALGGDINFADKGEGPIFARPLRTEDDLKALNTEGIMDRLQFLPRAVSHLKAALKDRYGIIGFAGAPWTLFCYMVQGKGSDEFHLPRSLLYRDPKLTQTTLLLLADIVSDLLISQINAGCDVVQLFDTWGGLLSRQEYKTYIVPVLKHIAKRICITQKPILLFIRGGSHLVDCLYETDFDGFSLDWRTPFVETRAKYPNHILQGNIDPTLLFSDSNTVRKRVKFLLNEMNLYNQCKRSIVNLGHGILPGTPIENVAALCEEVVGFKI